MPSYDPIFLSFNDESRDVVAAMDQLTRRRTQTNSFYQKWRRLPLVFWGLAAVSCGLDFALGYSGGLFIILGVGLIVIAMTVGWALRRTQISQDFAPQYQTTREVLYTLRDDLAPKRFFFGQLDLTGARQKAKVWRSGKNQLGRSITFYRDEWLSLKAKLYDGNMLRVSAVERLKVRDSYWKRSSSGKQKLKSAVVKGERHQLKVRLSVNPQVYAVSAPLKLQAGQRVGQYTIEQCVNDGGILNVMATTTTSAVAAQDLLSVLRATYDQLQRKVS